MSQEWDWPPRRHRYRARFRTRFDVYEPSGWNSPLAKKIVGIYWRITIGAIKILLSIILTIVALGSLWFLGALVSLATP